MQLPVKAINIKQSIESRNEKKNLPDTCKIGMI